MPDEFWREMQPISDPIRPDALPELYLSQVGEPVEVFEPTFPRKRPAQRERPGPDGTQPSLTDPRSDT